MIIDIHYHWEARLKENSRWVTELCCNMASRWGISKPMEEVNAWLRNQFDDPEGEKILQKMDEHGIDAVALLLVDIPDLFPDNDSLMEANKELGKIAMKNPNKIIAFGGINPTREDAPQLLRRAVEEFGIRGLKWHPDFHSFWPNDEKAYAMYEVAEELEIPILTHTGNLPPPSKAKFCHPMLYDEVLVDFPNLTLIAAHVAYRWWPEWSAIAEYKPNFYGDICTWQFLAMKRYEEFCHILRRIIDIAGVQQILFGTDSPTLDPFVSVKDWIALLQSLPENSPDGISFTKEEIDAIMGGNARRILGI